MAKRNLKRAAGCAALLIFGMMAVMVWNLTYAGVASAGMRTSRLTIAPAAGGEPRVLDIEVAETDEEKALGLMFRTSLADSHGILFPYFGGQEVTMWMRNTYIPLDMVFIRADGVIHRIEVRAEPLSDRVISSGAPVAAVLELAGGASGRLGIKPGDRVLDRLFGTAAAPAAPNAAPQVSAPETAAPGY